MAVDDGTPGRSADGAGAPTGEPLLYSIRTCRNQLRPGNIRALRRLRKERVNDSYLELLQRADAHFETVRREQPEALSCRRGCTFCCHGLFEITPADVAVLVEALAGCEEPERSAIIEAARRVVTETAHPDIRTIPDAEKERFFARVETIPCPLLDQEGGCRLYDHRPLVCRTFGLPLSEGSRYIGEECELNFGESTEVQRRTAAWNLEWEDVISPDEQYTIPEAILLAERLLQLTSRSDRPQPV